MVKGWEKTTIGNCCDILNGDRGHNYPNSKNFISVGVPFINAGHISNGSINFSKMDYIATEHYNRMGGAKLQEGDILFCLRGSLGKHATYMQNEGALASSLAAIRCKKKLHALFFVQLLSSEIISIQVASNNDGSSQPNLSATSLKGFEFSYPPLLEQKAIAQALSDADAFITALEKLIAKKQAIKQGTMEELLTGKRRLAGFDGEWVEKILDDLALDICTGNKNNEDKVENGKFSFFVRSDKIEKIDRYSCDCEAILVPGEGNIGNIFHYINGKFDYHQRVYKISSFTTDSSAKFLYYYFKMFFGKYALIHTAKATVDSLRLPVFKNFVINMPPTLSEQIAIAEILSDMDAEIDTLTNKLEKARNIKKGMMHELLTGNIRLVEVNEEDSKPSSKATTIEFEDKATNKGTKHSEQFDDAVMIAGIVNVLYSDKFSLGRVRVQKCLYLLRRYQSKSVEAFKKKAAGPYADKVRYKGGEPIAIKNGYIKATRHAKGTNFSIGDNMPKALAYLEQWEKSEDFQWVVNKLKFKKTNELELLATVDMAICDLEKENLPVSLDNIKCLIESHEEWEGKLKKDIFSDENIERAIKELSTLFQGASHA